MRSFCIGIAFAGIILLSGCATTDRKATIIYEPSVNASGGSGDLYLKVEGAPSPDAARVQWVIGEVLNNREEKVGNVVIDNSPAQLLSDAFTVELRRAGYRVIPTEDFPGDVEKGLSLSGIRISLDEADGLLKAEGRNAIKITTDIWRRGTHFKRLDYETQFTDSTFGPRSAFAADTLRTAIKNFLRQAVPEVVRQLEK